MVMAPELSEISAPPPPKDEGAFAGSLGSKHLRSGAFYLEVGLESESEAGSSTAFFVGCPCCR